jgi:hypothetical protein
MRDEIGNMVCDPKPSGMKALADYHSVGYIPTKGLKFGLCVGSIEVRRQVIIN